MHWLADKYGHRGVWLILLGGIWLVFGLGLLLDPENTIPGAVHQMVPTQARAAVWAVTALGAILVGVRGRGRDDSLGHLALWIMPAVRMLSYGGAWVLYLVSNAVGMGNPLGYDRGWYPALVWLFVVTMLRLVAAWPNPPVIPHPPTVPPEGDR